ncbi:ATP-binding response regulator [Halobellus rufus]|uniref:ATP-binding response regulator n=1 Tax=Halobellus rufus TaxID=1448860 RepID=UPI0006785187|nr:response regulator [Halobellus rufus]
MTGTGQNTEQVSVLCVDDDSQQLELTSTYLERLDSGLEVTTETDPATALERVQERPIDCIISDYKMPGMNGIELLREVREDYPNLPFILFTGTGSEKVASKAIEAGVTSYVQKGGSEVYEQLTNRIDNSMDRRRSERRARIARDRLVELYEQTDGFYILDSDWTVTYWNQQIAERTGISSEEILGETFWEVFEEATNTEMYSNLRAAMAENRPTDFELYYPPFDYWAEIRAYPVDDLLFVHSRETTQENERKDELERRNHIIQSFASTVSHDLRNPLNVAEGRLELAQETGDFEHLEAVTEAHNRMRNLIDELLRLARNEELETVSISLQEAAHHAWETVSSGPTELVVEDDVTFEAQASELRRLFENLFWNAIDHGDATTIRVGRVGDDGIFIADDGAGVPESQRDSVFESGMSTQQNSPGFGLSIVVGIVRNHHWKIDLVESTAGGARFEVSGIEFEDSQE